MKALTAVALAAALLTSATIASAQNTAPTTKVTPSPSNTNRGNRPTVPSGAEAPAAVSGQQARVVGHGKFCKPTTANGTLDCHYASMDAYAKHNKSTSLKCVANPKEAAARPRDQRCVRPRVAGDIPAQNSAGTTATGMMPT